MGLFITLRIFRRPPCTLVTRLLYASDFFLGNFELGTGPLNRLGIP